MSPTVTLLLILLAFWIAVSASMFALLYFATRVIPGVGDDDAEQRENSG